ncbi:MAG: fibronectin type III domain-containing protein [Clostridia bacterium]|nr:fibronectin type III domain-containing protein [Clostridia bacterium]
MKRKNPLTLMLILIICISMFCTNVSAAGFGENAENYSTAVMGKNSAVFSNEGVVYYKFIPTKSDTYDIYSEGLNDTYGSVYDSEWSLIASDDDSGDKYNFKLSCKITAGSVYYIGISLYSDKNTTVSYVIEQQQPGKVTNIEVQTVKSDSITLSWDTATHADGYIISTYDITSKKYKAVKTISSGSTTKATITNLQADKVYRFAVQSYLTSGTGKRYSKYTPLLVVRTKPSDSSIKNTNSKISSGYYADINTKPISIKGNVLTTSDSETVSYVKYDNYDLLIQCYHGDYGSVSELTHFFDYKGYYTIVYENGNDIYFDRYTTNMKFVSTIKISKKYALLGDVVTDKNGYYYIVWGQNDTKGNGGVVTMAVSKYSYNGTHIKTATYKTTGGSDSWETRYPFDAGNCSTIINNDGILICNYGREMYNGHQSNDILCVDTSDMKKCNIYSNYVSHSLDQRVLKLSGGGICFVNKGDAYPRGFDVAFADCNKKSSTPFHFYGDLGQNYINAWLGGVVEAGGNVYLVSSSAKSMDSNALEENQNLFIQMVGTTRTISGSGKRTGTSSYDSCTDNGVKWLTNYSSNYTVSNPQVVATDDGRIVVLWEVLKNDVFVQSYYMVLSADGMIIQKATPMSKTRLTAHEDPIYKDGYIYWTTAGYIGDTEIETEPSYYLRGYAVLNGNKGVIHKLKVGTVTNMLNTPSITGVSNSYSGISIKWDKVSGAEKYRVFRKVGSGSWTKVADTKSTSYTDKNVKSGTSYSYTVCCISSDGKRYTSQYDSKGKTIKRLEQPSVTVSNISSGINIKWNKVNGASGYNIYRKTGSGNYTRIKTISGNSTFSFTDTSVKSNNSTTYTYAVRAYSGSVLSSYTGQKMVRLTGVSLYSVTNTSRLRMTVNWSKNSKASGYVIQYSTNSRFSSGNKSVYVNGASSVSKIISNLTKGSTYYVRVRAYKNLSDKKYYSSWSSSKKIKITR